MARVALGTATTTVRTGVVATYAAFNTGDGNYFVNNQQTMLHVKNADSSDHVIHIITPKTDDSRAIKDIVATVAAGTEAFFGPYSNSLYGSGGNVQVDCYDASGPTFNNITDAVSSGTKDTTGVTAAVLIMGSL